VVGRWLDRLCDTTIGGALLGYAVFCVVCVVASVAFYVGLTILWMVGHGIFGG
jgi:hypothetical protein